MSTIDQPSMNGKEIPPEDREAALTLAKEDRLLMSDPPTQYIIEHNGRTPDGREVGDIGNFLAARREELVKNPPYLSSGTKRNISEIPRDSRGDDPDIWKKRTDK